MALCWSDRLDYIARTLVSGLFFTLAFASIWPTQSLLAAGCAGIALSACWNFVIEVCTTKGPDDAGSE